MLQHSIAPAALTQPLVLTGVLRWHDGARKRSWTLRHTLAPADGTARFVCRGAKGQFESVVTISVEGEFALLDHEVHARGLAAPVRLLSCAWNVAAAPGNTHVWSIGFDVWPRPEIRPLSAKPAWMPHWRAALINPASGRGDVFSYRLPARWLHRMHERTNALKLETVIHSSLAPGGTWRDDTLALARDAEAGTALAGPPSFHVCRVPLNAARNHGAWNSWDYYRLDVTADNIRENIEAISANATLRRFVKYIVIDDGWQDLDGDWNANANFPGGMAAIAQAITAAGFVPGLWAAPLFINCNTKLFKQHPEWCVQKNGQPHSTLRDIGCTGVWGDRFYLDPTRPEVCEHVRRMYAKLHAWGFRYFKTDFLSSPYKAAHGSQDPDLADKLQYHDLSQGFIIPHRRCMEALRAAIGAESFWLGCGSVWATGAGLMDGSRNSGDIAIYWGNVTTCAASAFWNRHIHGRLWLNDPDFLVVRGRDTSKPGLLDVPAEGTKPFDPAVPDSGPTLSLDEARVWASCVILSGGLVTFSDRIAGLNEAGIEILEKTCGVAGGPAPRPLEFGRKLPRWVVRDAAPMLLGCFNWDEAEAPACEPQILALLPDARWTEVWTERQFRTRRLCETMLQPHSALLLKLLE